MGPIISTGLKGMHDSYQKMTESAHQIARNGQTMTENSEPQAEGLTEGLASPLVEMKQQEHIFTASAKVVSVANETLGSFIDDFL